MDAGRPSHLGTACSITNKLLRDWTFFTIRITISSVFTGIDCMTGIDSVSPRIACIMASRITGRFRWRAGRGRASAS
jgi:hypothetical protein